MAALTRREWVTHIVVVVEAVPKIPAAPQKAARPLRAKARPGRSQARTRLLDRVDLFPLKYCLFTPLPSRQNNCRQQGAADGQRTDGPVKPRVVNFACFNAQGIAGVKS